MVLIPLVCGVWKMYSSIPQVFEVEVLWMEVDLKKQGQGA
jgi:hypothetical protein